MAWYPDKSKEFKSQATLYSRVIVILDGSVHEGIITFISEIGINVTTNKSNKFVKWANVQKVIK